MEIGVVSAAELAGELGPITRYANANAITGCSGLYPSRHQSDQTDCDSGPIIRQANRRLRCALTRIADNLACHCAYYGGATDDFGMRAVQDRVHVHDLHATILYLMGLDHERLTYRYSGRDFRLTDVDGHVVQEIIA